MGTIDDAGKCRRDGKSENDEDRDVLDELFIARSFDGGEDERDDDEGRDSTGMSGWEGLKGVAISTIIELMTDRELPPGTEVIGRVSVISPCEEAVAGASSKDLEDVERALEDSEGQDDGKAKNSKAVWGDVIVIGKNEAQEIEPDVDRNRKDGCHHVRNGIAISICHVASLEVLVIEIEDRSDDHDSDKDP